MMPKLVATSKASYTAREWNGENESGVYALDDAVLVLPDEASKKVGKLGLIDAPDDLVERHSYAAETGIVVDIGPGAFVWAKDRSKPFEGKRPALGQRVYFERYAGQETMGADGRSYRLMDDKCIRGAEIIKE